MLITILIYLILVIAIIYAVNFVLVTLPIDGQIKKIVSALLIIGVIVWILRLLGVIK